MIDEVFLKSAINIRRQYLKVSNNMELYHKKAKDIVAKLEETLKKVEQLQKEIDIEKSVSKEESISRLMAILTDLEDEGSKLEKLADPMNKEIEKLSKEEVELYRQIKEKHKDLTDDQIIKSVQDRLEKEGI